MALQLKYKQLLSLQPSLKQLHINNKIKHFFSYYGGCGMYILRHLKEELTWVIDKYGFNLNACKTVISLRN